MSQNFNAVPQIFSQLYENEIRIFTAAISNAHNSAVVYYLRLQFYTSVQGTTLVQFVKQWGSFSMMNFRHRSTLKLGAIFLPIFPMNFSLLILFSLLF